MLATQEICHVDRCPKGCTSETGCTRGKELMRQGEQTVAAPVDAALLADIETYLSNQPVSWALLKLLKRVRAVQAVPQCWCHACRPISIADMRMVLCPSCGNKRCPKANHHDSPCTGSNEPGQAGSAYP